MAKTKKKTKKVVKEKKVYSPRATYRVHLDCDMNEIVDIEFMKDAIGPGYAGYWLTHKELSRDHRTEKQVHSYCLDFQDLEKLAETLTKFVAEERARNPLAKRRDEL